MNTFKGANLTFPNLSIHFLLAEIIKFRKQLTVRQEWRSQSGWNDAMNAYMVEELNKIRDTIENITYRPATATLEEREDAVSDTTKSIADDYDANAVATDNVLMPTGPDITIVWKLDGTDPELPQMTPDNCPNDFGRAFITALDRLFVELTRLDSRHQPAMINKYEAVMMVDGLLNPLYTITQRKGGEVNRSNIPTGTLPSAEPNTFMAGS